MNTQHKHKPAGIECSDWEHDPRVPARPKQCRYFVSGGTCEVKGRFMCEEYDRAVARQASHRLPVVSAPPAAPETRPSVAEDRPGGGRAIDASGRQQGEAAGPIVGYLVVPSQVVASPDRPGASFALANPVPVAPKASKARDAAVAAFKTALGSTDVTVAEPSPFSPAKEIDPESIKALEIACDEIVLESSSFGTIHLVAKATGLDRHELTFREAATLRLLVDAFPGAQVVRFTRSK